MFIGEASALDPIEVLASHPLRTQYTQNKVEQFWGRHGLDPALNPPSTRPPHPALSPPPLPFSRGHVGAVYQLCWQSIQLRQFDGLLLVFCALYSRVVFCESCILF